MRWSRQLFQAKRFVRIEDRRPEGCPERIGIVDEQGYLGLVSIGWIGCLLACVLVGIQWGVRATEMQGYWLSMECQNANEIK